MQELTFDSDEPLVPSYELQAPTAVIGNVESDVVRFAQLPTFEKLKSTHICPSLKEFAFNNWDPSMENDLSMVSNFKGISFDDLLFISYY